MIAKPPSHLLAHSPILLLPPRERRRRKKKKKRTRTIALHYCWQLKTGYKWAVGPFFGKSCTQRPRSTRSFVSDVNSPFQCLFVFLLFDNKKGKRLRTRERWVAQTLPYHNSPPCPVDPTLHFVASAGVMFLSLSLSLSSPATFSSIIPHLTLGSHRLGSISPYNPLDHQSFTDLLIVWITGSTSLLENKKKIVK